MKKGKTVSIPTSVEAQIRTRARNLPIDKCYINEDWKELQYATIFIVRKHTNGNHTIGRYLVDLKLLGVKDCTYQFNESPLYMDEIIEDTRDISLVECDYNLAHNIIYAGLEFAEDYGFAPHKDFKTAQYILEEDSDDIPLMDDIPLGDDGIPVLIVRHGENKSREMSILDKTANGDYNVVFLDENGKPVDDQYDDDYYEDTYNNVMDEILKTGVDRYIEELKELSGSPRKVQVITDVICLSLHSEEELEWIDLAYDQLIRDPRILQDIEKEPEEEYKELLAEYNVLMDDGEEENALHELVSLMDSHPDISYFWEFYIWHLSSDEQLIDDVAIQEAYSQFPDDPTIKALYAEWLAQEERADDILEFFNHIPDLNALTTEQVSIAPSALTSFCCAYAMAWILKGEILKAEPYYQVIVRIGYNDGIAFDVQRMMTHLKMENLSEMHPEEE